MIDNPFRKKTASERLAENARQRFSAAADASQDAGERAREIGARTAEGATASAKSAGSALAGLVPTVAAAFAAARSKTAHGISDGVDASASTLSDGLDAAPEKVDHARDWIVDELLPKLQGMVDGTVEAKDEAADSGGALSTFAGETVQKRQRKGGVLMVLGLALLGGAAYFWYTDQKRRQGDPWQRVATTEDPWAGTERRSVSAAANPGAGMRSSTTAHTTPAVGEKVHLSPSEAAREAQGTGPVSALATGRPAQSVAPAGTGTTTPATSDKPATEPTTGSQRRFEDPATTGPIATGYAQKADDIAGDNAPTQSIPTVGERLNPVDARPSDNNVDPYGEGDAPTRKGTDEKWLRN